MRAVTLASRDDFVTYLRKHGASISQCLRLDNYRLGTRAAVAKALTVAWRFGLAALVQRAPRRSGGGRRKSARGQPSDERPDRGVSCENANCSESVHLSRRTISRRSPQRPSPGVDVAGSAALDNVRATRGGLGRDAAIVAGKAK